MWKPQTRNDLWQALDQTWDLIIIGGGITGAGIFRTAVDCGLKALLLEANDFSFGTSSRSSKLVHGGFRYLYNRQVNVTRESVRERERLLREAPHLVTPLSFCLPNYARYHFKNWQFGAAVALYDLLAPKWKHRFMGVAEILRSCKGINLDGLQGAFQYYDAALDDSRMVLRLIQESMAQGGTALNYARVTGLLRDHNGVCGVTVQSTAELDGPQKEVRARVVINAAGPWSDELRAHVGAAPRLRKLRGSHLVFPQDKFPASHAVTLFHPRDRRAMFIIPWEGVTLVGTTDLDHPASMEQTYAEPFATPDEVDYLLKAVEFLFPGLPVTPSDVIASFAGLRPVVNTGAATPSKESRAHAVWDEDGLITITGGKLTTFRIMAHAALQLAAPKLPAFEQRYSPRRPLFDELDENGIAPELDMDAALHLVGRHGAGTIPLLSAAGAGELERIPTLLNVWAELRWAARAEAVVHLDDLLLRRVRLGLLLPEGGRGYMDRIRAMVQPELGWDDATWQAEEARYNETWSMYYSPNPALQSALGYPFNLSMHESR